MKDLTFAIVFACLMGLVLWAYAKYAEKTETTFVAACEAVHGTAVWSGRHWECLK